MPWTIDAASWTRQLSSPILDGNYPTSNRPIATSVVSLRIPNLASAGRIGFFIDYSELSAAGTHTFYVARTHGSTGAVGVTYTTGGDTHSTVTGSITWADGEMDIKSFTVEVTSAQLTTHQTTNGLGEHRIWAVLSSPTGSGVLHFGTEHTRAYGVIDNDVVASDANAVFYDSAAAGGGDGTSALPYNDAPTAIQNLGTKRYMYGKGTTTVSNAFTRTVAGTTLSALPVPATRAGEATRVYVRNWGADTWTISGADSVSNGFITEGGESYCTYKGIDFVDLDCSAASGAAGILYRYNDSVGINIEFCTGDNLQGNVGGNHSVYGIWGVDGSKIYRCTGNNIQNGTDNTNPNTAVALTFNGKNISMQRCESTNCHSLFYHKGVGTVLDTSTSIRFCKVYTPAGSNYNAQGNGNVAHSYTISQCNLYLKDTGIGIFQRGSPEQFSAPNGGADAKKHWWCNNIFYKNGSGSNPAIQFSQAFKAIIFNNIMLDCRRVWAELDDTSTYGPPLDLADYNCHFGTTLPSQTYGLRGVSYANASQVNAINSNCALNDIIQNPLFTDAVGGDFTLQAGSPCLTSGIGGSTQGAYIGNFYTIGVN